MGVLAGNAHAVPNPIVAAQDKVWCEKRREGGTKRWYGTVRSMYVKYVQLRHSSQNAENPAPLNDLRVECFSLFPCLLSPPNRLLSLKCMKNTVENYTKTAVCKMNG